MLGYSMDPRSARTDFRLRGLQNWIIVFVLFGAVAFIAAQTDWPWTIDFVAIGILFYLFFFVLDKRAVGFSCPHCGKYISSNTPWTCGSCGQKNSKADDYPFVHRCEHCGAEPKAYKCHHRNCGQLVFLSRDELEEGYARSATASPLDMTKEETLQRERERQAKVHEITMADLEEKLAAYKKRQELGRKKNPIDSIRDEFQVEYADLIATEEFVREQRKILNERFKDDEYMRGKVDAWLDSLLARRAP